MLFFHNGSMESERELQPLPGNSWAYVVALAFLFVLVTALATLKVSIPFEWKVLTEHITGFRPFNFIVLLVLPSLFLCSFSDHPLLQYKSVHRTDIWIALLVGGATFLLFRTLASFDLLGPGYPLLGEIALEKKLFLCGSFSLWLASWLPGWELTFRWLLLRAGLSIHPRYGWMIVPLFEVLGHATKGALEIIGMALLSIVLTRWVLRRGTVLPALLVHAAIEVALIATLLTA